MNRFPRLFLLLVAGVFLVSSCSTVARKQKADIENTRVYKGDYDKIWYAALDVISEQGFPIINSQKKDGIITTDWMQFKRDTYSSGIKSWKDRANFERAQVSLRILSVGEEGTEVKVSVFTEDFVGKKGMLWQSYWLKTFSKGEVEKAILEKIGTAMVGKEIKFEVSSDVQELLADNKSKAVVTAKLLDEYGNPITTAKGKVLFSISGPGKLDGKNPASINNGMVSITVKTTKEPGSIEISAAFERLTSNTLKVAAVSQVQSSEPAATETGETGETQ